MTVRFLTLALLASGAAASAMQASKQDRAAAFTLDGVATPTPNPTPTPSDAPSPDATPSPGASTTPDAAPAGEAPAPSPAASDGALRASFTLDTPIADLIADPAAKAVLDKDLPGLSSDENLDKFAKLGLRQFQPLTGGQLTDALLVKVARDLSTLSGPMLAPIAPTATGNSKRNRDASR